MYLVLIAFVDAKLGIGRWNTIPFINSQELAHFRRVTSKRYFKNGCNYLLFGGRTYDTLPKKFINDLNDGSTNRHAYILRKKGYKVAYKRFKEYETNDLSNREGTPVFVCGGEFIYQQFINHPLTKELWISSIDRDYNCDKFFPNFHELPFEKGYSYNITDEITFTKYVKIGV